MQRKCAGIEGAEARRWRRWKRVDEIHRMGGTVPDSLAVDVTDTICRMRGTDHVPARCAALTGKFGEKAACGLYEGRPSPCREFEAGDCACNKARLRHGLAAWPDSLVF